MCAVYTRPVMTQLTSDRYKCHSHFSTPMLSHARGSQQIACAGCTHTNLERGSKKFSRYALCHGSCRLQQQCTIMGLLSACASNTTARNVAPCRLATGVSNITIPFLPFLQYGFICQIEHGGNTLGKVGGEDRGERGGPKGLHQTEGCCHTV